MKFSVHSMSLPFFTLLLQTLLISLFVSHSSTFAGACIDVGLCFLCLAQLFLHASPGRTLDTVLQQKTKADEKECIPLESCTFNINFWTETSSQISIHKSLTFGILCIVSPYMYISFLLTVTKRDRLCRLIVGVPGYRSRGPISILGSTRFSEK
jgi:hypothetical protein